MSDTNFTYMEVSAKRKKRNQFISVLIIVAIVLMGVIVWGWIELQKNRNAERIKNALNSQIEPGFKESEANLEPFAEPSVVVQDTPAALPPEPAVVEEPRVEPVAPAPAPAPAPVAVAVKPAKPKREPVKAADLPKEPNYTEPPAPKVVETKPAPAPKPEPVVAKPAKPTPEPKATPVQPPTQVAIHRQDPIPSTPAPSTPAPKAAPVAATKVYPPEDLPLPARPVTTEETRLAVTAIPAPAMPEAKTATAEGQTGSHTFKLGMAAYQQQDYVNAIRSFTSVPKPASKKRGEADRDEYVQANFLKGMSLLKVGHLSEAVSAFQNVLEYEKYYPMANMNLGICYVELKQYAKAHQAFEAVVRDQSFIEPAVFDDVMQRTKYFWALAWTRLYKNSSNPDKQSFYRQQAVLKWKDYEVWFSKNEKYKNENLKAENYLKSLSSL
ncbi:MAG: tetratricopeptide repeat protein [Fibrobacterota bacterium]|nr:tetratricopeptide repeat protein [Fibrobacterota bacterium]